LNPPPVLAPPHDPFDVSPPAAAFDSPAAAHLLAAAVGCPDRFLVAAPPGRARDRLVTALADELCGRGERLLLLADTAGGANREVEALLRKGVAVVRATAAGEVAEDMPAAVAAVTSGALGPGRVEDLRRRLADTARDLAAKLDRWAAAAETWEKLSAALARGGEADAIRAAEAAKAQVALPQLRQELAELAPMVEAKKSGRVFSRAFWRAAFTGDVQARVGELEARIRDAERTAGGIDLTPLPKRLAAADDTPPFAGLCDALAAAGLTPPAAATPEAVAAARDQADAARREAEEALTLARKTLTELESDPAAAAVQLLNRAAAVVGPRAAVSDPAVTSGRFDRILIEGAESVTRTDWDALASVSDRLILVGDFDPHPEPPSANGKPHTNGTYPTTTSSAREFWRMAHRPLWLRTDDRLIARLATVLSDTTREPLADRPEVELLFGVSPDGEYVLAEVAFPDTMGVAAAKAFVATDLGEVQLVPLGPARWHADQLLVTWPLLESQTESVWIDVADGVREQVVPMDGLPATAAVEFDAAKWTRESAEAWVAEKTRAARSRRTAVLPAEPALA
jgi:hypothetical protein